MNVKKTCSTIHINKYQTLAEVEIHDNQAELENPDWKCRNLSVGKSNRQNEIELQKNPVIFLPGLHPQPDKTSATVHVEEQSSGDHLWGRRRRRRTDRESAGREFRNGRRATRNRRGEREERGEQRTGEDWDSAGSWRGKTREGRREDQQIKLKKKEFCLF